jgi:hypothetical protein
VEDPVRFKAAYERFPAGIKGAFVLRGGDGLPHQVRIVAAEVAEWTGKGSERIPIEPAIIEVAPTLDTFVPFDVTTLDLRPGWYRIRCDVVIDAVEAVVEPGPRFLVPWPRGTVRRGTVEVGATRGDVAFGSLECAGDCVRLAYVAAEPPEVTLRADGGAHPVLEVEHDEEAGRGRVVGYPVLRAHERLAVVLKGQDPVEVALP